MEEVMLRRRFKNFCQPVFKKSQVIQISIQVALLLSILVAGSIALSQEREQDDGWQFGIGLYGWGASLGGELTSGRDISSGGDVSLDDILDSINFVFMGEFEVRKSRWLFMADVVYLDLGTDKNRTVSTTGGSIDLNIGIQIKAGVLTPAIGYSVVDTDTAQFNAFGGARYLDLEIDIEENTNIPTGSPNDVLSESYGIWDGIIGFKGNYAFNENWHVPFYFDLGAVSVSYFQYTVLFI